MIKLNKFHILSILAVLALGVIVAPANTSAQYSGYVPNGYSHVDGYTTNNNQNYYVNQSPNYVYTAEPTPAPVTMTYTYPTQTSTIYSSATNGNATTAPKTVAKAKTTTTTNATVTKTNTSTTNSNLTASAILGSGGFMPSGVIQWILFAILILLMVLLIRKIYGADETYHATPMKHN